MALWGRVSTAELARGFERHMAECREDKAALHKKLDGQNDESDRRHNENLARFGRIDRTIYIATGVAMAAVWAMTHGGTVLAKLIK